MIEKFLNNEISTDNNLIKIIKILCDNSEISPPYLDHDNLIYWHNEIDKVLNQLGIDLENSSVLNDPKRIAFIIGFLIGKCIQKAEIIIKSDI